ncbi:WD40-repeat-containing domain protein [Blastocladiella britannica]|nr:WD40-repeat-containing domain protein [Blastocladiella britannica]
MSQPPPPSLREAVLAITSADHVAHLTDVHSGLVLRAYKPCATGHAGGFTALSASAPHFAVLLKDKGVLAVFSHDRDQPLSKCPLPERLRTVSASPSGRLLAAGSETGKLYLWDAASGALLQVVDAHFQAITAIAWSWDEVMVASGSADAIVKVFEVASMADPLAPPPPPLHTLSTHTLPITALSFSHSPSATGRLFSASLDHAAKAHDLATGATLATYLCPSPIHGLALDPADMTVYLAGDAGAVYSTPLVGAPGVALAGSAPVISLRASWCSVHPTARVTSVAVSPSGTRVVAGTASGTVSIVDAGSRTVVRSLPAMSAPVVGLHTMIVHEPAAPLVSSSHGHRNNNNNDSRSKVSGSSLPLVATLARFKAASAADVADFALAAPSTFPNGSGLVEDHGLAAVDRFLLAVGDLN